MNKYFIIKKLAGIIESLFISLCITFFFFFVYISFGYLDQNQNLPFYEVKYTSLNFNYTSDNTQSNLIDESRSRFFQIKLKEISKIGYVFDTYFKENNSPLYGYGQVFIDACKRYNAPSDCTLLPAIAKIETDLCTTDISAQQYNCWGFGGSGENRIVYNDFQTAIFDITNRLMQGYGKGFFEDPELGELFYCGSHCNLWGDKVKLEQNRLRARIGYNLR